MPVARIFRPGIAKAYKKFHVHPCLFARKMPLGRTNGKPLNQGL
jgi:hypothetical protein